MLRDALVNDDAAAPVEIPSSRKCPHCGEEVPTLEQQIERRLAVPATARELAALFDMTIKRMRGNLSNLRRDGRIKQLDRTVPCNAGRRGRQYECLWVKA